MSAVVINFRKKSAGHGVKSRFSRLNRKNVNKMTLLSPLRIVNLSLLTQESSFLAEIDLSKIDPNPASARLSNGDVEDLGKSLLAEGQLSPVKVRHSPDNSDRYQLIYGHRRVEAAKLIGWIKIRAEICNNMSDERAIEFALTENMERDNYTDYELGLIFKRLNKDYSKSLQDIATLVRRSKSFVSQHAMMTEVFDSCKIETGEKSAILNRLTERQTRLLFREPNPEERLLLAKICINEGLGVKELERLVGHPRRGPHRESFNQGAVKLSKIERARKEIASIIYSQVEGSQKKDLSYTGRRLPGVFSYFDDFPPYDLIEYASAEEHSLLFYEKVDSFEQGIDHLSIRVLGKTAYATFFVNSRIHYGEKWISFKSRVSFFFAERKDRWFVVHEHWSPCENKYFEKSLKSKQYVG